MLQRLTIDLGQEKADNISKNLLNEIHEIVYALYWAKKMTTKVLNSKNSKILLPYRQLLNLYNKIKLKRNDKYANLSNLSTHSTRKKIKKSYKSFRIATPTWNEKFESP